MRNIRRVTFNRETFHANCGDLLLDSAMLNGIGLPHDCRAGICGTCRVRLVEGNADLLARMISHEFTLERAPEAIQFAISNPTKVMKVVILGE